MFSIRAVVCLACWSDPTRQGVFPSQNPQVAARLATTFNAWRRFGEGRRVLMEAALLRIKATQGLSKDTYEIVSRTLA